MKCTWKKILAFICAFTFLAVTMSSNAEQFKEYEMKVVHAEDESETFTTNTENTTYSGTHFKIDVTDEGDSDGFFLSADCNFNATITSLDGSVITRIDVTRGCYDGRPAADKGTMSASGDLFSITGVNSTEIKLIGCTGDTYCQIKEVKIYYSGASNGNSDLSEATYTLVIPASLTVKNAGWNDLESDISAKGSISNGNELVVSAESQNEWTLKSGDNSVKYKLAANDQKEKSYDDATAKTLFSFSGDELKGDGISYKAGIVVEDYSNKPAGIYEDIVTFTASVAASSEQNTVHSDAVEWDYAVISPIDSNSTFTKDGVTLTTTSDSKSGGNFYDFGNNTFSSSVGNFTKIEMLSTYANSFPGATVESGVSFFSTQDNRTVNGYRVVWTGNSQEVSFQADIYAVEYIKFTFADSSNENTSSTSAVPAIASGVMWKKGESLDFGDGAYLKSTWWDETVQRLTGEISLNFIDTGNGDHYYCGVQTFGDYNLSDDDHLSEATYGLEIRGSGTEADPYYGVPVHTPINNGANSGTTNSAVTATLADVFASGSTTVINYHCYWGDESFSVINNGGTYTISSSNDFPAIKSAVQNGDILTITGGDSDDDSDDFNIVFDKSDSTYTISDPEWYFEVSAVNSVVVNGSDITDQITRK